MEFISLKYDYAFRTVFSRERVRKQGIPDVAVRLHDGTGIDIEMQVRFQKLRDKRGREFSDLFEVHIIELKKPSADAGNVGEWIQLFNAESMEELNMIKTKNAGILEAREILRTLHMRNPLRLMYEQHLKEVRDRKAEDAYVRDLGRNEGLAKGLVKGETTKLIDLVCRKMAKGKTIEEIASELEEDVKEVACIYRVAAEFAPDYDREKILMELKKASE